MYYGNFGTSVYDEHICNIFGSKVEERCNSISENCTSVSF